MVCLSSLFVPWNQESSCRADPPAPVYQPLAIDLLNPSAEHEKRSHKLKRLVQSPNSYFMDVKCPGA